MTTKPSQGPITCALFLPAAAMLLAVLAAAPAPAKPAPVGSRVQKELFKALEKGDTERVRALVRLGADIETVPIPGYGALAVAAMRGDAAMVRTLLELGAEVNPAGEHAVAPLVAAATAGKNAEAVAAALLDAGARESLPDGTPVADAARMAGNPALAAFLDERLHGGSAAGSAASGGARSTGGQGSSPGRRGVRAPAEPGSAPGGAEKPRQPGREVKRDGIYPPGLYSGPCSSFSTGFEPHPAIGDEGSEGFTATVFLEGRREKSSGEEEGPLAVLAAVAGGDVVRPPDCKPVPVGLDGVHTKVVVETVNTWKWACAYETTMLDTCKILSKRVKNSTKTSYSYFTIDSRMGQVGEARPLNPSLTIVAPAEGDQFVFDGESPGIMVIDMEGRTEDCTDPITWQVEDVGYSEKTIRALNPNASWVHFRGLPRSSSDFGPKKITASACGKTASVTVETFFSPKETNHPGEGSAVTPNWFYYWAQTSAGKGFTLAYQPERLSLTTGKPAQAQYDYDADVVVLTDLVFDKKCYPRPNAPGGKGDQGIDCFAELARHESWHRKERWDWWGTTNPMALSDHDRARLDYDFDLVPDRVERARADRGCDPEEAHSCSGRPAASMPDVEMDAYAKGWAWPVGSANAEDWSSCFGAQWKKGERCQ